MKKITVITINDEFTFTGKYRRDLEKDNWHCYETSGGSFYHFRKEHIVAIFE